MMKKSLLEISSFFRDTNFQLGKRLKATTSKLLVGFCGLFGWKRLNKKKLPNNFIRKCIKAEIEIEIVHVNCILILRQNY